MRNDSYGGAVGAGIPGKGSGRRTQNRGAAIKKRFLVLVFCVAAGLAKLCGETSTTVDPNPTGDTGALKAQVQTGGSYDAHSGNATRVVTDLHVPGALGVYGLDFTRYWNSLQFDWDETIGAAPDAFGWSGWYHSWGWTATYREIPPQPIRGSDQEGNTYITAIDITFPDGHTTRFKIARVYIDQWMVPGCEDLGTCYGPPYSPGEIQEFTKGGEGVHDHICNLNAAGTDFYLCLADGGSVHFVDMQATEVFDPHGLRTELRYTDGNLTDVIQDGGRFLKITWGYFLGGGSVITQVQGGIGPNGTGTTQTVTYQYGNMGTDPTSALVLQHVIYENEPDPTPGAPPGQKVSAQYTYGTCWDHVDAFPGQCTYPNGSSLPLLQRAVDPHFAGPMTVIRYAYKGEPCPHLYLPPEYHPNYVHGQPYAIAAEMSDTGVTVSSFSFTETCDDGLRQENDGLGNSRIFYFGSAAAAPAGGRGFQLCQLTDFFRGDPTNVPSDKQNYIFGLPHEIWDGRGLRTEALAAAGDDSGQLAEIHRPDGSVDYYNRVSPNSGTAPIDPARGMHNPYNHWVFSETHQINAATSHTTTYKRDSRRRVYRIDHPDGSYEEFLYNNFNQVTSHTLASVAPNGQHPVVHYEYDTRGLLLQEWNDVDGQSNATINTYYTSANHPEWTDLVETTQNARARVSGTFSTKMSYNGRHQVVREEYPATIPGPNPFKTYEYDANGNCRFITDELGHRSEYQYDSYRRCISYIEPLNAPGWNGGATVASRRWDWSYDRYFADDPNHPYDPYAHTSKQWRLQYEPAFDAAGNRNVTARWFDANDRIVDEDTGVIQSPGGGLSNGPDIEVHHFGYDENGQKKNYIDPRGRETTYTYDNRNRLWKTNEPLNRMTETLYDFAGNKTTVRFPVEAAGQRTQQWLDYDAFGQASRFIDERGNTTNLTFKPWGPMKKLYTVTTHRDKDGGGTENQLTTFTYDGLGRPTQVLFPDLSHEDSIYQYAQLHSWSTRKSQTKTFAYDARGREISHTWSDSTPGINRTWDAANRMKTISNLFSSIGYEYDDAGQVLSEGNTVAGAGGGVQTNYYRYPNGSVAHFQFPYGFMIRKDYNSRGQLQTVGWDDATGNWVYRLADYHYYADGKVEYQSYGNGIAHTDFGYDGRGMMSSVRHYKSGTGQNLAQRIYGRDERDRITWWKRGTDSSLNGKETGIGDKFAYDPEGQLTDAWYLAQNPDGNMTNPLAQEHFQYDQLGNRFGSNQTVSHGTINFTRKDNGLNQYHTWGSYPASYDDDIGGGWANPALHQANGVLMQEGNVTAGYNALNQAIMINTAAMGSNWMFFGYDPLGRCVKRWSGALDPNAAFPGIPPANSNPATYFYYDGWNMVQEGPSGTSPTRVYAHGARVDEIAASSAQATGQIVFHHYDAQGNCIVLSDSVTGNIVEQYDYEAFGKPYYYNAAGTELTSSLPWNNRFLFTGREYLSELKLYDYRNRMYQPELGRFMQPDPKEFLAGDYNLYRYCHNDPVNMSDPMGLEPIPVKDDVDKASRDGLAKVRDIARKSGDGFERAKSTGRGPDGKVFLGEPTTKGEGTPHGPQKVEIPEPKPGSGINPESGVHAHRDNGQTDGNGRPLPPGGVGPMSSNADRHWADQEQRPIYTISESGKMIERYRPDDSGRKNGGVTERWNGQNWDSLKY